MRIRRRAGSEAALVDTPAKQQSLRTVCRSVDLLSNTCPQGYDPFSLHNWCFLRTPTGDGSSPIIAATSAGSIANGRSKMTALGTGCALASAVQTHTLHCSVDQCA